MDDKISDLSIKQRLKSVQTSHSAQRKVVHSTSQSKIYAPEQYNYFSYTIDKEIKHQGSILQRIKKQIQNFKAKRKTNAKIKNSYEFDHKSFNSKVLRKHRLNYHRQPETAQSMNISRKNSDRKSANKLIISNATHIFQEENTKIQQTDVEVPCFLRSGGTTPLEYFEQAEAKISKLIGNKQNGGKKPKAIKRPIKNDEFSITGSQPIWKQFQSYYRSIPK